MNDRPVTDPLDIPEALSGTDPADRSLVEDARALASSARALAQAELAYQKARAAYAAGEARSIAMLGAVAAVLVFFSLMALTFGLVLGLSMHVGPWIATAIVCGALLIVALILALMAKGRAGRMTAQLSDKGEGGS